MTKHTDLNPPLAETKDARDWVKVLSKYRDPNWRQSWFEVIVTAGPFLVLWALAWWALSYSYLLALGLSVINGLFLVRLFTIQHDCGHGSFFTSREACDWLGRVLGVLTLTPYDVWRRTHSIHHSAHGNLGRRGIGDIHTMTVEEYRAQGWFGRLSYRIYRNPIVLFGFGPSYLFFFQNRLPVGLMNMSKYWVSAMATNLVLLIALGVIFYFGGLAPIFLIFVPSTLTAATVGMWLFYVQHQFEDAHWKDDEDWQLHDAALHGSSYYVLPKALQWMSANIGIHHVHHLYSRIPFYRLPEVLRDQPELASNNRMTIRESLASARLHLWDQSSNRLLSFRQVRKIYG
ncbi:fatty acid desaturase [Pelagimonas varians]|uniref:Fatty acid desaturase n=1 Tax=Pelagimonas varians TaxID=696760 RepID=A0A238KRR9_9RHOB|nr:fatty acid desaturase [Pelagimonas varians]PYG28604.1 omega-6 fatty acid desaturase (delta-12 desaturase) [Pelagimonas varians]SMX45377.1 Fatty acid desaturase [Pelagimonas varians]